MTLWMALWIAVGLANFWLPGTLVAANPARFVARFSSGTVVEGNSLSDWHLPEAVPKLESQPLFDATNPVRWLVDRSLSPSSTAPDAFVEMTTGDRLPGVVTDFRNGDESPYSRVAPHFLVRYISPNNATLEPQATSLRIDANFVRRIVWNRRRDEAWQPKTVFLRDGSFLKFRSIRWSSGSVSLLLDSGPRRFSWSELSEIHLAPREFWHTYFDELAVLTPDGTKRLLQLDTTSGLILTTSLDRTIPRYVGDSKDVNRWVLGTQPAWSLDLIWVWQGTVWARRSFAPQEVPLSRVPPVRVEQHLAFGSAKFPFTTNRNLQFEPLRSASREAGWGFGVQAFSELEFELPASARALRSEFAIDAAMKSGGCVQPRVVNATAGNTVLYQGPVVTGSESVLDTGSLNVNGSAKASTRVVLQVDPVLNNRPVNSDPFNIRDQANWLDPTVELDTSAVKQQIDSRLQQQILAWSGWDFQDEPGSQVQRVSFLAESATNFGEYRSAVGSTTGAIKLTKTHMLRAEDRWLVIDAVRTQSSASPCKLSVKVGDAKPTEWDLPLYDKNRTDFRPLIVPLAGFQEKKVPGVPIEVRQLASADRVLVHWRAVVFAEQHPLFYRLLEDAPGKGTDSVTSVPKPGSGVFDDQQKFAGTHSYRLPVPTEYMLPLKQPIAIRERPQLGEHRFVRFAVRKQGGGTMRVVVNHANEVERPASYEAGKNPPEDPNIKRLSNQEFSKDWQLFTRDLYGDFGNLDVTGLVFQFADGEQAWIDHVYFAPSQSSFDIIKSTLK